jgi:hypothetical protein
LRRRRQEGRRDCRESGNGDSDHRAALDNAHLAPFRRFVSRTGQVCRSPEGLQVSGKSPSPTFVPRAAAIEFFGWSRGGGCVS